MREMTYEEMTEVEGGLLACAAGIAIIIGGAAHGNLGVAAGGALIATEYC